MEREACTALIEGSGKFKNLRTRIQAKKVLIHGGCYVEAVRIENGEAVRGVEVTIAMAKAEDWVNKTGSKWKTMPELMLAYRASAFSQEHIPNALMGVSVEGEVEDIQKTALPEAENPFPGHNGGNRRCN